MPLAPTTARRDYAAFEATRPTPEQARHPSALALKAAAAAEYAAALLIEPDLMLRVAADHDAMANRYDESGADYEAGAARRFAVGNNDVALDWASMGEAARRCAVKARAEAAELRARAASVSSGHRVAA